MGVVLEGVPAGDAVRVLALAEQLGLADRIGLIVELLPEQADLRVRVHAAQALVQQGQHAAGAGRGVIHSANRVAGEDVVVRGREQIHQELHRVSRGEVLARGLVGGGGEAADQVLEEGAHLRVGDGFRGEVDGGELLQDQEEAVVLVQLGDRLVELVVGEQVRHVLGEPVHVGQQVRAEQVRLLQDAVQGEGAEVVERQARAGLHQVVQDEVRMPLGRQLREELPVRGHDRLHAAQDGEREDERAVLVRLEHAPELIRDPPHEVREVLGRAVGRRGSAARGGGGHGVLRMVGAGRWTGPIPTPQRPDRATDHTQPHLPMLCAREYARVW